VQNADGTWPSGHRDGPDFRTLFISDIHLGTRACQADAFLDFLRVHDAETIYLVGDIIDFWRVKRGPIWLQSHNDVLQKLLRKVRKGTRVIFIPGNHDEALRDYCGMNFGGIEIHHDFVHVTADGRRMLVMHGDEFDVVVRYAKWLAFLGDRGYEFALWCNHPLNWVRRRFGFGFWSLSAYLKQRVKSAVNFIGEFEHAIAEEAKRRKTDGVICGHIHHAADRIIEGIRYINCGDWVESRTAIAEDYDGRLRLIRWQGDTEQIAVPAALPVPEPRPLLEAAATPALGAIPAAPARPLHIPETRHHAGAETAFARPTEQGPR
jgi:UDP-2,3-diacylglucosamine pyrophosphatase LpxH